MLDGQPGNPKINTGVVDVRNVADLHVLAMTHPDAAGERFLATAGESLWLADVARVLRRRLGWAASGVRRRMRPNWLVRLIARDNPSMRNIVPLQELNLTAANAKARRVLGCMPRLSEEAIFAAAEILLRLGMVRESRPADAT